VGADKQEVWHQRSTTATTADEDMHMRLHLKQMEMGCPPLSSSPSSSPVRVEMGPASGITFLKFQKAQRT
jgi:hypothetical protein